MRYWRITCIRGHAGTGHGTEITFAIAAKTLIEAQAIARKMPSVKHTRGILYGREISYEEYTEYKSVSAYRRAEGR